MEQAREEKKGLLSFLGGLLTQVTGREPSGRGILQNLGGARVGEETAVVGWKLYPR